MKFTINTKELKTMMEKTITVIDKKASLPDLRRLYLEVEENGTVKIFGTDFEHYVEIKSNNARNTSAGMFGIDVEDVKVLAKMTGEITLETVNTENKINVKCEKKTITIPKYENTDLFLPSMDNTKLHVLTMQESWLLETITNLYTYTSANDSKKLMQVFNFNTIDKRVEALDGFRIGMRSLKNQRVETEIENPFDSVKLHNKCMPVFKKIMDKKSEAEVKMYQDKKYIKLEGKDFTYIIRRIDGDYFKINQMLSNDTEYTFNADKENMLSVMKYNCDIVKQEMQPVVFHSEDGKLYSYMVTSRYEIFDELKTTNNTMNKRMFIGFNPKFLVDVFSIIDTNNPVCRGKNNKSPMFIDGNEYSFVILPVNFAEYKFAEGMEKHIERNRVA